MSNVKRLPDSYAKSESSNNYKLLNLNEQAIADLKKDMIDVLGVLDLQKATGKTLDLYGDMYGQKRGQLNDTQYRYMIVTRVGIGLTQGSYESVIALAQRLFNCSPSDIVLDDSAEACKVEVIKFPLEVLVNAGFSSTQAVKMLEMLLPVGVTITDANFEGTFEFAATENEYNENAGFGNIEQTIGGYLGLLLGDDENAPILPI